MSSHSPSGKASAGSPELALVAAFLAVMTALVPLKFEQVATPVGLLLLGAGLLELLQGFRRTTWQAQRDAWQSAAITLGIGLCLLLAPTLATSGLVLLLAVWFGGDALRHLFRALRALMRGEAVRSWLLGAVGNLLVVIPLVLLRGRWIAYTLAGMGCLRILGTAWNLSIAPTLRLEDAGRDSIESLQLPDSPEVQAFADRWNAEEVWRSRADWGWVFGFIATLFAIHLGRMGFDRTVFGILSPAIAVLGDLGVSLLLGFALVIPAGVGLRWLTRGVAQSLWNWVLQVPAGQRTGLRRWVMWILERRTRRQIRLQQARRSLPVALRVGLQVGLPLAAIIAATAPIWGMSWYFDTENWAAGMWNSWAEARTDTWREAMVRAIAPAEAEEPADERFAVFPPGVGDDFSFLVIGDTGEGDASQHVLRDQYLQAVRQEGVKFVVVSSDVVYPTGAMRDYELKFWLPFKGTNKPVYAIPGNHDWYDALEGFAATFLEPDAARRAMQARLDVDRGISTTTDRRIEQYLAEAARLQHEYGVPVRQQAGPFFQVQTPHFALFAVDTGVARRVDPEQWNWLVAALEASRGKTKMAILGHPFYAGGRFVAEGSPDFVRLHDLLREHGVAIVMAGDTHDLEFYREPGGRGDDPALHFVNGGGGAYLSFGTPLDWPTEPATADWAIHPSRQQVVDKIDATTPLWKWPVWWWTRQFGAWPFSAELLSAAFDTNVAPFYQSFCEIRVEVSQRRLRIIPWGVHGPLKWRDLQTSSGLLPTGTTPETPVEWIVPFDQAPATSGTSADSARD